MKLHSLTSLLLATATLAWAVPSEINYQGRLTDANGDAVTGDVTMSLKMFDSATDGNEIYSEDIGTVTLDSNGVYSFEFGAGGQSVVDGTETIATTDGTNSIFNATLKNLPVDGSVSISDGTYTWSQANGSSSTTEFSASVTPSSGAVSAIYLGSAPTASTEITASYSYMDATLSGALSSHASHWLELSVDGTAQSPRERILSVPFAQVAATAEYAESVSENKLSNILVEAISAAVSFSTSERFTTIAGVSNAANGYIGASVDPLPSDGITRIRIYESEGNSLGAYKYYCYYSDGSSVSLFGSVVTGNNDWKNPFPEKTITSVIREMNGYPRPGSEPFYFFRTDTISIFETTGFSFSNNMDHILIFALNGVPYPQDRSDLQLIGSSGEAIEGDLYKPILVPAGFEISKVVLRFNVLDEMRSITQLRYNAYPISN